MESLVIPETVAPPAEAYRYWPSGPCVSYGEGKKLVRLIFYKVTFTDYEEQQLELFNRYMQEKYREFQFPEWLGKEERIRVLLGCKFDMKRSAEAVFASIEWRQTCAPSSYHSLFDNCAGVLQTGAIYIHGRDHRYRPLLVLNVERLNLREHQVAEYRALICFLLEFMTKEMMIPGQVENWVVITDLCKTSLFSLPISELKSLVKLLQDNFRCRMTVNYIVNAPTSLTLAWKVIKVAIEEHTLKKLRILNSSIVEEMSTHFAPHQYEEKYGGTAPNAAHFWPPVMPPGPYCAPGEPEAAHLTDNSSYFHYFPQEHLDTDTQRQDYSQDDKLRAVFTEAPAIKQDPEDAPDPDSVNESLNISVHLQPPPPPPVRKCCSKCKRCTLI